MRLPPISDIDTPLVRGVSLSSYFWGYILGLLEPLVDNEIMWDTDDPDESHLASQIFHKVINRIMEGNEIVEFPIGGILPSIIPLSESNWLPCDGRLISLESYPKLSAAFPEFNPITGFLELPDLRGRFPLGESPTHPPATVGGKENVVLQVANLPPHQHVASTNLPPGVAIAVLDASSAQAGSGYGVLAATEGVRWQVREQGGGGGQSTPVDIMPPYQVITYYIRVS